MPFRNPGRRRDRDTLLGESSIFHIISSLWSISDDDCFVSRFEVPASGARNPLRSRSSGSGVQCPDHLAASLPHNPSGPCAHPLENQGSERVSGIWEHVRSDALAQTERIPFPCAPTGVDRTPVERSECTPRTDSCRPRSRAPKGDAPNVEVRAIWCASRLGAGLRGAYLQRSPCSGESAWRGLSAAAWSSMSGN